MLFYVLKMHFLQLLRMNSEVRHFWHEKFLVWWVCFLRVHCVAKNLQFCNTPLTTGIQVVQWWKTVHSFWWAVVTYHFATTFNIFLIFWLATQNNCVIRICMNRYDTGSCNAGVYSQQNYIIQWIWLWYYHHITINC